MQVIGRCKLQIVVLCHPQDICGPRFLAIFNRHQPCICDSFQSNDDSNV